MKRLILVVVVLLLALSVMASDYPRIKLMRLYVINKSEHDVFLRLYETTLQEEYVKYLTIPAAGYVETERVFTIPMGIYNVEASYCEQEFVTMFTDLELFRSEFTIPVPPCNQKPVSDAVADGVLKLSPYLYPPVDFFESPIIYDLSKWTWRY